MLFPLAALIFPCSGCTIQRSA